MYCNLSPQRNNLIKLTHVDGTKQRANDSQIVKAKENFRLSHSGPRQRLVPGTNPSIRALSQDHH